MKDLYHNIDSFLNDISSTAVFHFILSILVIAAAFLFWRIISRLFNKNRKRINASRKINGSALHLIYNIAKYAVLLAVVLIVLRINGVNVTAMIAGLGLVSAVIGLALQDEIKDVIMGVHLMADDFFKIGDVILYNGITGKVISYSLKAVQIESITDHNITTICNRNISEVTKLSNILDINVPLSYREPVEKVNAVLEKCCERIDNNENVITCLYLGTQAFQDSSILYRLRIFASSPEHRPELERFALRQVQLILGENSMSIPFPQLDIHTDKAAD